MSNRNGNGSGLVAPDGSPLSSKQEPQIINRLIFITDGDGTTMLDIPDTPERTIIFPTDYHLRFQRAAMMTKDAYSNGLLKALCKLLDEIVVLKNDGAVGAQFITTFSELVAAEIGDERATALFTKATELCAIENPDEWVKAINEVRKEQVRGKNTHTATEIGAKGDSGD